MEKILSSELNWIAAKSYGSFNIEILKIYSNYLIKFDSSDDVRDLLRETLNEIENGTEQIARWFINNEMHKSYFHMQNTKFTYSFLKMKMERNNYIPLFVLKILTEILKDLQDGRDFMDYESSI
uniref:Uncharacterized protein n=1 Tax=Onchocerca volvulus TaxID=6282 RepID=A0A8R1TL82_ONCVO